MMSGILRNRPDQYEARRDDKGTWRVVNLWDNSLAQFGPEDDIPDDHQAVTILSEAEFLAVIKEAAHLGILENALGNSGASQEDYEDAVALYEEAQKKLETAQIELDGLKRIPPIPERSETFEFRSRALEAVLKLAGMSEVGELQERQ